MGPKEALIRAAVEEIVQGIENDEETDEIAEKAVKKMEYIILELEKKEEESGVYEISIQGRLGDILSQKAVIEGSSRALSGAIRKILQATALKLGKYDPLQAAFVVQRISNDVTMNLLKLTKK